MGPRLCRQSVWADRARERRVRLHRDRLLRRDDGRRPQEAILGVRAADRSGRLADIKRQTNAWEAEYAALGLHPEPRPLNLDPGYITLAKLVLASTKDHAHRIYLGDGIYAEVTLAYRDRRWQPLEWTYPDYRRDDYQQFFTDVPPIAAAASSNNNSNSSSELSCCADAANRRGAVGPRRAALCPNCGFRDHAVEWAEQAISHDRRKGIAPSRLLPNADSICHDRRGDRRHIGRRGRGLRASFR